MARHPMATRCLCPLRKVAFSRASFSQGRDQVAASRTFASFNGTLRVSDETPYYHMILSCADTMRSGIFIAISRSFSSTSS